MKIPCYVAIRANPSNMRRSFLAKSKMPTGTVSGGHFVSSFLLETFSGTVGLFPGISEPPVSSWGPAPGWPASHRRRKAHSAADSSVGRHYIPELHSRPASWF